MMEFSWDERKRKENWKLRKVDFAVAIGIFDQKEILESLDDREAYGEERIQAIGKTDGKYYMIVYTWRDDVRHIITAWELGEHGKKRYQTLFARRNQDS